MVEWEKEQEERSAGNSSTYSTAKHAFPYICFQLEDIDAALV
jgi:hypothetical protein